MEYLTLNNGKKIPMLGFGVYQVSKEEAKRCVKDAIKVGYRHIDTAQSYFNEEEVGEAILECINEGIVKREDLFITTKVWIDNYGYDKCYNSVKKSLEKLKLDYLDLILLHQPFSDYYGAYKALEKLYEEGYVKSIGVSNFYPSRLADICSFERKIIPQVNQIEINPLNQQKYAKEINDRFNVALEAWAPFGEGRENMFSNPTLKEIGDKYNKSVAQVILRWLTMRGIVALAKTTHIERMKENFDIFDFTLDNEDLKKIEELDKFESLFFKHDSVEAVDLFMNFVYQRRGK